MPVQLAPDALRDRYYAELERIEANRAERKADRMAFQAAYLSTGFESPRLLVGIAEDSWQIAICPKSSVRLSAEILDKLIEKAV